MALICLTRTAHAARRVNELRCSQTSCVLPLAFDMVPPEERLRVFGHLVKKITEET
jgi:hypothetical protein